MLRTDARNHSNVISWAWFHPTNMMDGSYFLLNCSLLLVKEMPIESAVAKPSGLTIIWRNSYLFSKLCLKFGVCNWLLMFAIDFWCLQLTFDVFNWVYSKHMIHYNKVNWKNFAKNFLKIFPIDFQSPIDFSQLHMIRPLIYGCPFHINVNENHLRKMSSKDNLGAHFVWHIFQLDSIALLGSLSTISN